MTSYYVLGHRQTLQLTGKERALASLLATEPPDMAKRTTVFVPGPYEPGNGQAVTLAPSRSDNYVATERAATVVAAGFPPGVVIHPYGTQSPFARLTQHGKVVVLHDRFFQVTAGTTVTSRAGALYRKVACRVSTHDADLVLVSSPNLANTIRNSPVEVARWGVDLTTFHPGVAAPSAVRPNDYLLMLGGTSRRKNVLEQAAACLQVSSRFGLRVVIVGAVDTTTQQLVERSSAERVVLLSRVPDAQLAALYRHAACVVLCPSSEGYGLPILEAMASGARVVTTEVPSLLSLPPHSAVLSETDRASIATSVSAALEVPKKPEVDPELLRALSHDQCGAEVWATIRKYFS